jgi:hypothetical protein
MFDFDSLFNTIKDGTADLAKETFKGYKEDALEDARAFLEKIKNDAKRWANLAASGDLTADELVYLMKGKEALLEMVALKRAGLALVQLDKFKSGLINIVVDGIFKLI